MLRCSIRAMTSSRLALSLTVLASLMGSVSACHQGCSCDEVDMVMYCQELTNITWSKLLSALPKKLRHLTVKKSSFLKDATTGDPVAPPQEEILDELTVLEIDESNLEFLQTDAFHVMPNVNELRVNNVDFNSQIIELLSTLSNVKLADLSYNNMEKIPESLLDSWTLIRNLDLRHNQIKEFNLGTFQKASVLEHLDLSHNNISFVHPLAQGAENWTFPDTINLKFNHLSNIHPSFIHNLSHSIDLHLSSNPWDCHCGTFWLSELLTNTETSNVNLVDARDMKCMTPEHLKSTKLVDLNEASLHCEQPVMFSEPVSQTILFLSEGRLECDVTGYPPPSVYWETPRGLVVHESSRQWVPANVSLAPGLRSFDGPPNRPVARVVAEADGSLYLKNFRYYFEGEYTCVGVNPAGWVSSQSVNVTVTVHIKTTVRWSLMWGFSVALFALLLGIIQGSIRLCVERVRKQHRKTSDKADDLSSVEVISSSQEEREEYDDVYEFDGEDFYEDGYYYYDSSPCLSKKGSPRRSPMKCVTPAEGFDADLQLKEKIATNIRETLEGVRARLRLNMERHVGKMRTNMRRNMKSVRHTTGHYMRNIKQTGSQYVHKVRDGVVLGVEQVKYHVQSMKEMCGTGDLTHTISTISMSTDVDSQQQQKVVKRVTFV